LHSAARRPEFEPATYSSLLIEPQNVPEEKNSLNWYGKSNTNWFAVHSSQSCSLTPFILRCIFAYLIASDSALMLTLCVLQMLLLLLLLLLLLDAMFLSYTTIRSGTVFCVLSAILDVLFTHFI